MYMNVQPEQRKNAVSAARAYARLGEASSYPTGGMAKIVLPQVDLWRMLSWFRERLLLIAIIAILGMGMGTAFGVLSQPRFTSHADILLNPSSLKLLEDDLFAQSVQGDTQLMDVESKLRVMTGGNVLQSVVAGLDLVNDPEFVPPASWLDKLREGSSGSPSDRATTALRALSERVTARREERSYFVVLSAWSHDPQKSVVIVNAIVDAFKRELARGESESAAQAAASLSGRLDELRLELNQAEDRVAAFKRENNLQDTMGELTSERSMTEVANKVLDAQERLIQAESRYNELLSAGIDGSASAEANASITISTLRVQSATLRQDVDSLSMRLGPQHPTLQSAQAQLQVVEQQIASEIRRITEAARSELEQARSSYALLNEQANSMRSTVFIDNQAQIELRALERDIAAKSAVYEAFLARASEAAERQTLDSTNIRIVTEPVAAISRTYPPRTLVLAAAGGMLGLLMGVALAAVLGWARDFRRLALN
jgi:succinoglycan biosynthesis transport protein ExoP